MNSNAGSNGSPSWASPTRDQGSPGHLSRSRQHPARVLLGQSQPRSIPAAPPPAACRRGSRGPRRASPIARVGAAAARCAAARMVRMRSPWTAAVAITDTQALLGRLRVVREQRVTTTDGRVLVCAAAVGYAATAMEAAARPRAEPRRAGHRSDSAGHRRCYWPLGRPLFSRPRGRGSRSDRPARAGSAGGRRRGGGGRAMGGSLHGRQCGLDRPGARGICGTGAG